MASVRLVNVEKSYGRTQVVKNLNLDIKDKQFVVILGPSGCGKSTTLRMIAGLENVTSGDIYIGERRVNDLPPKDRDVAMVFQNYALYPHMTVYDNLAFALKLRKVPKQEISQRVHRVAEILEISRYLDRRPTELSGGERQRVALGRAMVREPQVFLMDEPLSNVDAKLRVTMRAEILRLHRRVQTTTIYVTHDQTEAMTLADSIVVMNKGVVQQVGTPEEIYNYPVNMFVAGFVGSPPMNFVQGELHYEDGKLWFVAEGMRLAVPAAKEKALVADGAVQRRKMVLGFRPEHAVRVGTANGKQGEQTFAAKVDVIEMLGPAQLVYLKVGPHLVAVQTGLDCPVRSGDAVTVDLNVERSLFFDPSSDKRVA